MEDILTNFFTDTAGVCGHEATLHANFMHHLLAAGVPCPAMAREYRVGGNRIDLVLNATRDAAGWARATQPTVAFEFKGGAHGYRNALREAISSEGYCTDLDKLAAMRRQGVECWFVCTDMVELGIVLSHEAQSRVAAQCSRRGIHFAYHAQNQREWLLARAGQTIRHRALRDSTPTARPKGRWLDSLTSLREILRQASFTEDTVAGVVYHALQLNGFDARQLSLETYFKCGGGRGRMQDRPDLCVFGDRVGGRFNLYRGGDPTRSNDGIKIGDLRALIEIKGSDGAARVGERAFARQVCADIDKLAAWRSRFEASGYFPGDQATRPDYVMIAVDNRNSGLAPTLLRDLEDKARGRMVDFHYFRIAP